MDPFKEKKLMKKIGLFFVGFLLFLNLVFMVSAEEIACNNECVSESNNFQCIDSDGGKDYYVKGTVNPPCAEGADCGSWIDSCNDDNVLIEYFCDGDNYNDNFEYYECSNGCKDGACADIGCYDDTDCGTEGFIGSLFCTGDDVFQDYKEYTCSNPGTVSSSCSYSLSSELIETCPDTCVNGACADVGYENTDTVNSKFMASAVEIVCNNDFECDDSNLYTYDECYNPGTDLSYCSHLSINCVIDNDCGTTGFIGDEFCTNDDVYKQLQNSSCLNPGTLESECEVIVTPVFLIDCGEDFCGNWGENYCEQGNVYRSQFCFEQGCISGGCFMGNPYVNEEIDEECLNGCSNGECLPECSEDNDCHEDFYDEDYCDLNNVVHDFHDFSCLGEECVEEVVIEIVEECSDICVTGVCEDVECYDNLDCGINYLLGELFCQDNNVFDYYITYVCESPGTISSYCSNSSEGQLIDECDSGCYEGMCLPECSNDNDCPEDSYDENYCDLNNVFQDFHNFSCQNELCVEEISQGLVETCVFGCFSSFCIEPECYNNSDCGTVTSELICENDNVINRTTIPSCLNNSCDSLIEEELVEECDYKCSNGKCFEKNKLGRRIEPKSTEFDESVKIPNNITGMIDYSFIEGTIDLGSEVQETIIEESKGFEKLRDNFWMVIFLLIVLIFIFLLLILFSIV